MFICKYCEKKFNSNHGLSGHISHCKNNLNKKRTKDSYSIIAKKSAITQNENRIKYKQLHPYEYELKDFICNCEKCGKEFTMLDNRNVSGRTYCSLECKHKYLSKHTGGYRKGSGHGKSGWYKGIHCDSTWELAFVIYHLDNNLKIERYKEPRTYIFK